MSAEPVRRAARSGLWIACLSLIAPALLAASIDTDFLEQSWPHERVRHFEVGRYDVRWRERASRKDGIFAGVQFEAPRARQLVWDLANDYTDVGQSVPGVTAVRFLERQPTRQVIQLDVKVLWKKLRLTFEVEQDAPNTVRFRLVHAALGEYRGLCRFTDGPARKTGADHAAGTVVELTTWLKPSRPVPMGLVLLVERMSLLPGVKSFLKSCEQHPPSPAPSARIDTCRGLC